MIYDEAEESQIVQPDASSGSEELDLLTELNNNSQNNIYEDDLQQTNQPASSPLVNGHRYLGAVSNNRPMDIGNMSKEMLNEVRTNAFNKLMNDKVNALKVERQAIKDMTSEAIGGKPIFFGEKGETVWDKGEGLVGKIEDTGMALSLLLPRKILQGIHHFSPEFMKGGERSLTVGAQEMVGGTMQLAGSLVDLFISDTEKSFLTRGGTQVTKDALFLSEVSQPYYDDVTTLKQVEGVSDAVAFTANTVAKFAPIIAVGALGEGNAVRELGVAATEGAAQKGVLNNLLKFFTRSGATTTNPATIADGVNKGIEAAKVASRLKQGLPTFGAMYSSTFGVTKLHAEEMGMGLDEATYKSMVSALPSGAFAYMPAFATMNPSIMRFLGETATMGGINEVLVPVQSMLDYELGLDKPLENETYMSYLVRKTKEAGWEPFVVGAIFHTMSLQHTKFGEAAKQDRQYKQYLKNREKLVEGLVDSLDKPKPENGKPAEDGKPTEANQGDYVPDIFKDNPEGREAWQQFVNGNQDGLRENWINLALSNASEKNPVAGDYVNPQTGTLENVNIVKKTVDADGSIKLTLDNGQVISGDSFRVSGEVNNAVDIDTRITELNLLIEKSKENMSAAGIPQEQQDVQLSGIQEAVGLLKIAREIRSKMSYGENDVMNIIFNGDFNPSIHGRYINGEFAKKLLDMDYIVKHVNENPNLKAILDSSAYGELLENYKESRDVFLNKETQRQKLVSLTKDIMEMTASKSSDYETLAMKINEARDIHKDFMKEHTLKFDHSDFAASINLAKQIHTMREVVKQLKTQQETEKEGGPKKQQGQVQSVERKDFRGLASLKEGERIGDNLVGVQAALHTEIRETFSGFFKDYKSAPDKKIPKINDSDISKRFSNIINLNNRYDVEGLIKHLGKKVNKMTGAQKAVYERIKNEVLDLETKQNLYLNQYDLMRGIETQERAGMVSYGYTSGIAPEGTKVMAYPYRVVNASMPKTYRLLPKEIESVRSGVLAGLANKPKLAEIVKEIKSLDLKSKESINKLFDLLNKASDKDATLEFTISQTAAQKLYDSALPGSQNSLKNIGSVFNFEHGVAGEEVNTMGRSAKFVTTGSKFAKKGEGDNTFTFRKLRGQNEASEGDFAELARLENKVKYENAQNQKNQTKNTKQRDRLQDHVTNMMDFNLVSETEARGILNKYINAEDIKLRSSFETEKDLRSVSAGSERAANENLFLPDAVKEIKIKLEKIRSEDKFGHIDEILKMLPEFKNYDLTRITGEEFQKIRQNIDNYIAEKIKTLTGSDKIEPGTTLSRRNLSEEEYNKLYNPTVSESVSDFIEVQMDADGNQMIKPRPFTDTLRMQARNIKDSKGFKELMDAWEDINGALPEGEKANLNEERKKVQKVRRTQEQKNKYAAAVRQRRQLSDVFFLLYNSKRLTLKEFGLRGATKRDALKVLLDKAFDRLNGEQIAGLETKIYGLMDFYLKHIERAASIELEAEAKAESKKRTVNAAEENLLRQQERERYTQINFSPFAEGMQQVVKEVAEIVARESTPISRRKNMLASGLPVVRVIPAEAGPKKRAPKFETRTDKPLTTKQLEDRGLVTSNIWDILEKRKQTGVNYEEGSEHRLDTTKFSELTSLESMRENVAALFEQAKSKGFESQDNIIGSRALDRMIIDLDMRISLGENKLGNWFSALNNLFEYKKSVSSSQLNDFLEQNVLKAKLYDKKSTTDGSLLTPEMQAKHQTLNIKKAIDFQPPNRSNEHRSVSVAELSSSYEFRKDAQGNIVLGKDGQPVRFYDKTAITGHKDSIGKVGDVITFGDGNNYRITKLSKVKDITNLKSPELRREWERRNGYSLEAIKKNESTSRIMFDESGKLKNGLYEAIYEPVSGKMRTKQKLLNNAEGKPISFNDVNEFSQWSESPFGDNSSLKNALMQSTTKSELSRMRSLMKANLGYEKDILKLTAGQFSGRPDTSVLQKYFDTTGKNTDAQTSSIAKPSSMLTDPTAPTASQAINNQRQSGPKPPESPTAPDVNQRAVGSEEQQRSAANQPQATGNEEIPKPPTAVDPASRDTQQPASDSTGTAQRIVSPDTVEPTADRGISAESELSRRNVLVTQKSEEGKLSLWDRFKIQYVDDSGPLKKMVEGFKQKFPQFFEGELGEKNNPYVLSMLSIQKNNAAQGNLSRVFNERILGPIMEIRKLESMVKENGQLRPRTAQEVNSLVDLFHVLKSTPELNARFEELHPGQKQDFTKGGYTNAEATRMLNEMKMLRPKEYELLSKVQKNLTEMLDESLNSMVEANLIEKMDADELRRKYPNYAPMYAYEQTLDGFQSKFSQMERGGISYNDAQEHIRSRMGGGAERGDVISHAAKMLSGRTRLIVNNEVAQGLYNFSELINSTGHDKNFVRIYDPYKYENALALKELMIDMGTSPVEANISGDAITGQTADVFANQIRRRQIGPDGTVQYRDVMVPAQAENIIRVKRKNAQGELQDFYLILNAKRQDSLHLAKFYNGSLEKALPTNAIAMGYLKTQRMWNAMNTGYNPFFGLKNFSADYMDFLVTASDTVLHGHRWAVTKKIPDALKLIYQHTKAVQGDLKTFNELLESNPRMKAYEEFKKNGGAHDHIEDNNRVVSDFNEKLIKNIDNSANRNIIKKALDAYTNALSLEMNSTENAVRFASYEKAMELGMSKNDATLLAKEITANFDRKGVTARKMNGVFSYLTANIAGQSRVMRMLGSKTGAYVIGSAIAAGFAQQAIYDNMEPQDAASIPDYIKQSYMVFPTGNGGYIKIRNRALSVFYNMGQQMSKAADGRSDGVDSLLNIFNGISPVKSTSTMAQTFTPTLAQPLVAVIQNKSWAGGQISSSDPQGLVPRWMLNKPGTNPILDNLSRVLSNMTTNNNLPGAIDWSAQDIAYVLKSWSGGALNQSVEFVKSVRDISMGKGSILDNPALSPLFAGQISNEKAVGSLAFALDKEWRINNTLHTKYLKSGNLDEAQKIRDNATIPIDDARMRALSKKLHAITADKNLQNRNNNLNRASGSEEMSSEEMDLVFDEYNEASKEQAQKLVSFVNSNFPRAFRKLKR